MILSVAIHLSLFCRPVTTIKPRFHAPYASRCMFDSVPDDVSIGATMTLHAIFLKDPCKGCSSKIRVIPPPHQIIIINAICSIVEIMKRGSIFPSLGCEYVLVDNHCLIRRFRLA
ncbi:hypothetical protein EV426DRAFT_627776 [Tirmania nivea]|nr:hypothetical protein EV426DRAFT_627776 [Tirmania nivea]